VQSGDKSRIERTGRPGRRQAATGDGLASLPRRALASWLADAHALADLAARRSLPSFRSRRVRYTLKGDGSPVTPIDRAVEAAMRARLQRLHPEHGVLGEEGEAKRADAEFVWVLDPIDGTKSYISGIPQWGTLIALLRRGEPVLGVIDVPALGERWSAAGGQATRLRRSAGTWTRCRASACRELEFARLCLPEPSGFTRAQGHRVAGLVRRARIVRYGGDCHAYALLASGALDLIVESGLEAHDVLGPLRVIENAGGVISDWSGGALRLDMRGDVIAAATPELHARALQVLAA
jgi:histidinol phosphatase-like enzyme (inositol monophosphatase family)